MKKVNRNYSGKCLLRQLPSNTYFKLVKKDGSLSKTIYYKDKNSWNKYTRKYDICSTNDIWGAGREMKGDKLVSTNFIY